jgi:hypothetical protein
LIWATSKWWQGQFEEVGFTRESEVERALHDVYDPFFLTAPARKSFFVFSKGVQRSSADNLAQSIRDKGSSWL